MAEINLVLKIDLSDFDRPLEKFCAQTSCWSDERREAFADGWDHLVSHGAQAADTGFVYGKVWGWLSDDFRKYAASWGVKI